MKDVGKLSELNLKAGDVVEHVSGSHRPDYWAGVPWTVRDDNGELLAFTHGDNARSGVAHCTWIYRVVSRANSGPVRTVTRKEIVPGVYGKVLVTEGLYVHVNSMKTASEIRAAIETMTKIAEAWEGQQ